LRRTLTGDFRAHPLRPGRTAGLSSWHLATGEPTGPDIYLTGVDAHAAEMLRDGRYGAVDLEWLPDGVRLTLRSSVETRVVQTQGAVLHEPLGRLYEALPLEHLDPAARRFWRRVFRLVRIPGGRHLLKLIARGARASK